MRWMYPLEGHSDGGHNDQAEAEDQAEANDPTPADALGDPRPALGAH
jgi:hypothetical protein